MNSRNDYIHGNVDPFRLIFKEVFFDSTIPVFREYEGFAQSKLKPMLKYSDPVSVLKDLEIAKKFVDFILDHLNQNHRRGLELLMNCSYPGWSEDKKMLGVLFPEYLIEVFGS